MEETIEEDRKTEHWNETKEGDMMIAKNKEIIIGEGELIETEGGIE